MQLDHIASIQHHVNRIITTLEIMDDDRASLYNQSLDILEKLRELLDKHEETVVVQQAELVDNLDAYTRELDTMYDVIGQTLQKLLNQVAVRRIATTQFIRDLPTNSTPEELAKDFENHINAQQNTTTLKIVE